MFHKKTTILKYSGFTLLELLTVLGILSFLSTIAWYSFFHLLPRYRLKSAAIGLFSDLQSARMQAIKSCREYAIVFNTDEGSYHIVNPGEDGVFSAGSHSNDDVYEKTIKLADYGSGVGYGHGGATRNATISGSSRFPSDNVSYSGNAAEFNAQGMANKIGYVYLSNNAGSSYAVSTPTMAGVVIFKRWTGSNWR